jgi:tartrate dehydrogenase/decarboxylase/D-malate dehydrogenase
MMLEHLGQKNASNAIIAAIEDVIENPATRTGDMGSTASTAQCGDALVTSIRQAG